MLVCLYYWNLASSFFFCNIMLMWRTFPVEWIVEIVRECTEDFMRHIAFGMASRMGS